MSDIVDFIMDFECGEMTHDKMIAGFQKMLESGVLFKMQGFYSRRGKELLDAGLITIPEGMEVYDYYGNRVYPDKTMSSEF